MIEMFWKVGLTLQKKSVKILFFSVYLIVWCLDLRYAKNFVIVSIVEVQNDFLLNFHFKAHIYVIFGGYMHKSQIGFDEKWYLKPWTLEIWPIFT